MHDPCNAFVVRLRIDGAASGALAGRTFAVKDLLDVAGLATGGGNPDWAAAASPAVRHAAAVQRLLDAGAALVGKTQTDELSRGIFGENSHLAPVLNPRAPGRVPGGSSSGSAAAVAAGLADLALGTDTGGSVRVPASFCGLYGVRPSLRRVPMDGCMPQAPGFDTIGWLAREADLLVRAGEVLLGASSDGVPLPRRLILAEDAFAIADEDVRRALLDAARPLAAVFASVETRALSREPLGDWLAHQAALQGHEAWRTFGPWLDRANPRLVYEVADAFLRGARVDDAAAERARAYRAERRAEVLRWLDAGTVVALPTAPCVAPQRGQPRAAMWALRARVLALTCIAGTLGAPQVTLPLAEVGGLPVGLSFIAAPGNDEALLALVRELA